MSGARRQPRLREQINAERCRGDGPHRFWSAWFRREDALFSLKQALQNPSWAAGSVPAVLTGPPPVVVTSWRFREKRPQLEFVKHVYE